MPKWIRPKPRLLIPGSFLVRALSQNGPRYACGNCGDRMFVRYASGLCPHCFNGQRPWRGEASPPTEVPHHLALAGVLDDPSLD